MKLTKKPTKINPKQVLYRSQPMLDDIKKGFHPRPKLSRPSVTIDDVFAYAALLGISATVIYAVRGNSKVTLISIILNIFFGLYFITKKFK